MANLIGFYIGGFLASFLLTHFVGWINRKISKTKNKVPYVSMSIAALLLAVANIVSFMKGQGALNIGQIIGGGVSILYNHVRISKDKSA